MREMKAVRELKLASETAWPALTATAMLLSLAIALLGAPAAVTVTLAALASIALLLYAAPTAVSALLRRRSMLVLLVLSGLIIAWIVAGFIAAGRPVPFWYVTQLHNGRFLPAWFSNRFSYFGSVKSWPWRVGRLPLLPLLLAVICAGGGFVLVADAVRVQIGLARAPRSAWRSLTANPSRGGRIAVRAIPGVVLIGVAVFLGISLISSYTESHPIEELVELIALAACSAFLILSPVAIGLSMRLDFDKEGRAREEERRRFAAHLHDSVLQTLALIQRQASDPETVAKLARRQEHALRAWMAGEADLSSATVATAVREMVSEVEDEHEVKIELTAIGDTRLDQRSEEMISAAREALRNAARHAPGAPVNVFLDIGKVGTELFVRDNGPGFQFSEIPAERRGLRDAVIGRMGFAGGSATVESTPGEGTEIALTLPHNGRSR
jgi:signal transduction histidine kinase